MLKMRSLAVALAVALVSLGVGLPASGMSFVEFTGDEFNQLVGESHKILSGLNPPGTPGSITGNSSVDDRIWDLAFDRGYAMAPVAKSGSLVYQDGFQMQLATAAAWEKLQASARQEGFVIQIASAYRSLAEQRALFLKKLYGTSNSALAARLQYISPPGASRHHGGYALDIRQTNGTYSTFASSPAFTWISKNNYYNAKRFGFVPSYPPDAKDQGPNPEPWEYVYVGLEVLARDVTFVDVPANHFAYNSVEWLVANGYSAGCGPFMFCTDDLATRGEVAVFMKRILGPTLGAATSISFVDTVGHPFEDSIGWLAGQGITLGCDPPTFSRFCPERPVTRGEISALFKRAVGHLVAVDPAEVDPRRFLDTQDSVFVNSIAWLAAAGITEGCNPPANTRFCPRDSMTRAELAVFLRRIYQRL